MTNYKGKKEFKIGAMLVAVLFLLNMVLPVHVYGFDTNATFEQGNGTISSTTNELGGNDINVALAGNSQVSGSDFGLGVNDRLFVTGGDFLMNQISSNATDIYGSAFSNFVLGWFNPNGVFIHDTANIQASGVIAAAMSLNTALNGQYLLQDGGLVVNDGTINATNFVLLAGGAIENTGTINAPVGEVHIAAGDVITVGLNGNGSISVGIDAPVAKQILDEEGNPITDQIKNAGTITANRVSLQAKAAQGIFDYAINQEGIIRVTAVQEKDGIIELIADGDIKSSGTLEGDKLIERGASFKLSGNYNVKESEIDNLDGAINLGTGNYSGVISDVMNIIVDPNAVITLVDTLRLIADSDGNGTGAFIMGDGSSIVGNNHNLGISSAEDAILRTIDNVNILAVGHIDPAATPVFQMKENISSLGNLIISEGTTFKVEGGRGDAFGVDFVPTLSFDNPDTIITNNGTLEIETNTIPLGFIFPFGSQGKIVNIGGDTGTGTVHYTGNGGLISDSVIHGGNWNNVINDPVGLFSGNVTGNGLTVRGDLTNNGWMGLSDNQSLNVQGQYNNNGVAIYSNDVNFNLANGATNSADSLVLYIDTEAGTHNALGGSYGTVGFIGVDTAGAQWNVDGDVQIQNSFLNVSTDPSFSTFNENPNQIVNFGTHDVDMSTATGQLLADNGLQVNGNNVYNTGTIEYEIKPDGPFIPLGTEQGTLTNVIYNTDAGTVRYSGNVVFGYDVQGGEYHNLDIQAGAIFGGGLTSDTTVHGDLTIGNGGALTINDGQTLTMTGGTFSNDGRLLFVDNAQTVGMTNDVNSGAVWHLDTQGNTYNNLPLGNEYNGLALIGLNGSAPATWNTDGNVTIHDSIAVGGGGATEADNPTLNMGTFDLDMSGATGTMLANMGLQGANNNNVYNNGTIEYEIKPDGPFIPLATEQGTLTNVIYNTDAGTVRYEGNVVLGYSVQGGDYHNLEIDANAIFGGGLTSDTNIHGNLTITNNGALRVNDGQALNMNPDGTPAGFSNDGRLIVMDNAQLDNFTNDTDSGAVWYLDTQNNTYNNLEAGTGYNDVVFISIDGATGNPGTGSWTPQGDLDVNGDFVHASGTFEAPAQINVGGDFVRGDATGTFGTFNANGGTVILDGTNQMITGNTTFNNLEKVGPNETLLFQAGSTQTITGTTTLRGDATGNLTLNAASGMVNVAGLDIDLGTTPSNQWIIDPQGARDISFVSVGNSINLTGPAINPLNSVNLGNTVLWFGNIPTPGGNGAGTGITGNISNALLAEEQPQLPGIEIGTTFLKNKIYHCAATQAGIDMPSSVHNGVMLNSPDEKLPVGVCGEINPKDIGFGADQFQTTFDSFVPFQYAN